MPRSRQRARPTDDQKRTYGAQPLSALNLTLGYCDQCCAVPWSAEPAASNVTANCDPTHGHRVFGSLLAVLLSYGWFGCTLNPLTILQDQAATKLQ